MPTTIRVAQANVDTTAYEPDSDLDAG